MSKEEKEATARKKEIIATSIDFIVSQRSLTLYGHSGINKARLAGQEAFAATTGEYGGTVVKLGNNGAIASYGDAGEALKSAIRVSTILNRRNSEVPKEQRLGFTISINQGDGTIEGDEIYGLVANELRKMANMTGRQNDIYISENLHGAIMEMEGAEYQHAGTVSDGFSIRINVYEVFWKETINLEAHANTLMNQFQNRYHLIEGVNEPCFYCGSRRHLLSGCPSKHLPEITQTFDRLGRQSVAQINRLFSEGIARGLDTVHHRWENTEAMPDGYFDAYYTFYDIKRVYQLRFFRIILGYGGGDWEKATRMNATESDGGVLQVALDHLRTGNLVQAELLLKKLNEDNPEQFSINMAMGYLNIERGHHAFALGNFGSAHRNANTKPRKILALLLMSRIHDLYFNDMKAAAEQISLIRRLENDCPEAIYQGIVMGMRSQKDSADIRQLLHLIRNHQQYYLIALIDPEFSGCQAKINSELHLLFAQAKENAASSIEESENCLNRLELWLGTDNQNARNLRETFAAVKELYTSDSYLGYLDVVRKAPSIIADCDRLERKGREEIKHLVTNLRYQISELSDYCLQENRSDFVDVLMALKKETAKFEKDLYLSISHKDAGIKHGKLSEQVMVIQRAVDKIQERKAITSYIAGLSIRALLYSTITASLGLLILFVIDMGWLSGNAMPSIIEDDKRNVLIISVIIGVILTFVVEHKRLMRKQKRAV